MGARGSLARPKPLPRLWDAQPQSNEESKLLLKAWAMVLSSGCPSSPALWGWRPGGQSSDTWPHMRPCSPGSRGHHPTGRPPDRGARAQAQAPGPLAMEKASCECVCECVCYEVCAVCVVSVWCVQCV